MIVTFYYQFYQKTNVSVDDHFKDVRNRLDSTLKFSEEPIKQLVMPYESYMKDKKDAMTFEIDGVKMIRIFELEINILVEGEDSYKVSRDLLEFFSDATSYRILEEGSLNEPE